MAEIEVKKLSGREMFGYLGGKTKFTPKKSMMAMGFAEEDYYSVTIEPMSDEDCETIRSYNADTENQFGLWMAEKGKDYTDAMRVYTESAEKLTKEQATLINEGVAKRKECKHNREKFSLVQKYITSLTKPHPEAKTGEINKKAWRLMPIGIKQEIYNEIIEISYMSNDEAINLQ